MLLGVLWLLAPASPSPPHVPGQVEGTISDVYLPHSSVHRSVLLTAEGVSLAQLTVLLKSHHVRDLQVDDLVGLSGRFDYQATALLDEGRFVFLNHISLAQGWFLVRVAVQARSPQYQVHLHLNGFPYGSTCNDTHLECGLAALYRWSMTILHPRHTPKRAPEASGHLGASTRRGAAGRSGPYLPDAPLSGDFPGNVVVTRYSAMHIYLASIRLMANRLARIS